MVLIFISIGIYAYDGINSEIMGHNISEIEGWSTFSLEKGIEYNGIIYANGFKKFVGGDEEGGMSFLNASFMGNVDFTDRVDHFSSGNVIFNKDVSIKYANFEVVPAKANKGIKLDILEMSFVDEGLFCDEHNVGEMVIIENEDTGVDELKYCSYLDGKYFLERILFPQEVEKLYQEMVGINNYILFYGARCK